MILTEMNRWILHLLSHSRYSGTHRQPDLRKTLTQHRGPIKHISRIPIDLHQDRAFGITLCVLIHDLKMDSTSRRLPDLYGLPIQAMHVSLHSQERVLLISLGVDERAALTSPQLMPHFNSHRYSSLSTTLPKQATWRKHLLRWKG